MTLEERVKELEEQVANLNGALIIFAKQSHKDNKKINSIYRFFWEKYEEYCKEQKE